MIDLSEKGIAIGSAIVDEYGTLYFKEEALKSVFSRALAGGGLCPGFCMGQSWLLS